MSFSRWWTETTAALGDLLPLPLAALLLLLAAALAALAWYHWPAWVPRRLPRLRLRLPRLRLRLPRLRFRLRLPRLRFRLRLPRLRFRLPRLSRWRRRRRARPAAEAPELPRPREEAEPPRGPALSLADRLAAEGRFAEAVRERLRGMVRRLVASGAVEQRPGMTVTELTEAAARNRPPVDPTLRAAGTIFSELWYARRTASAEHDRRMRELADELDRVLAGGPEEPR
ncbi:MULTISPECIES: DUF4129 domain-containing protein [unclassified Micromonospora]|uniref:DUF4129 domain-containing protein n=1 Tax=unclassified Micromonospora TaxID=2617518 RepID=UPI002FF3DB56